MIFINTSRLFSRTFILHRTFRLKINCKSCNYILASPHSRSNLQPLQHWNILIQTGVLWKAVLVFNSEIYGIPPIISSASDRTPSTCLFSFLTKHSLRNSDRRYVSIQSITSCLTIISFPENALNYIRTFLTRLWQNIITITMPGQ
jgi:hypothetical protein